MRATLLHFTIMRLFSLINPIMLFINGIDIGSPVLFFVALVMNILVATRWRQATEVLISRPYVAVADVTLAAMLMWFSGGSWSSPYYVYALFSLMIASFFLGFTRGFFITVYFVALYTIGLFINPDTLSSLIENNDFDVLSTSYVGTFIVPTFFGYPAHVIRQIELTKQATAKAEHCVSKANVIISAIATSSELSSRELEILSCLNKGQSNLQIAQELHIAEKTVKNHLYRIYKKLGVSSREEASDYFQNRQS